MDDTNPNISNSVGVISTRENEVFLGPVSSVASLYAINNLNVPVQANSHLSYEVAVPGSMQFLNVENGPLDYYFSQRIPFLLSANFEEEVGSTFMPLVTAVISRMYSYM